MIIGVDHIGWSLPSAQAAAGVLTELGYARMFSEPLLRTAPEKRGLLRAFTETHAIEYWRHASAPGVETIVHSATSVVAASAFPTIVCTGTSFGPAVELPPAVTAGLAALGVEGGRVILMPTGTSALQVRKGERPILAYVVATSDLDRATSVWCSGLGARPLTHARDFVLARVDSRLPQWRLDVLIVKPEAPEPARYLDDEGFLSVGLLTTDLVGDQRRVEQVGLAMIQPFATEVNRQRLRITMGRGAGGEIIELIAVV